MPNTPPIKLGSARAGGLIFNTSTSRTSDSGIDEATVIGLYGGGPIGANTRGRPYSAFFDNGFLPDTYLSDSIDLEYLEGQVLRATIVFKRPNPNQSGRTTARIFVDSVINYNTQLLQSTFSVISFGGATSFNGPSDSIFGFPEPVVTVKYNSTDQPSIGDGGLSTLYALPGTSRTLGFPTPHDINIPQTFVAPAGATVTYLNGTTIVTRTVTVDTTFRFTINFKANPLGWQLTRLKADPTAGSTFYDIEENWRNFYACIGSTFLSATPP